VSLTQVVNVVNACAHLEEVFHDHELARLRQYVIHRIAIILGQLTIRHDAGAQMIDSSQKLMGKALSHVKANRHPQTPSNTTFFKYAISS